MCVCVPTLLSSPQSSDLVEDFVDFFELLTFLVTATASAKTLIHCNLAGTLKEVRPCPPPAPAHTPTTLTALPRTAV